MIKKEIMEYYPESSTSADHNTVVTASQASLSPAADRIAPESAAEFAESALERVGQFRPSAPHILYTTEEREAEAKEGYSSRDDDVEDGPAEDEEDVVGAAAAAIEEDNHVFSVGAEEDRVDIALQAANSPEEKIVSNRSEAFAAADDGPTDEEAPAREPGAGDSAECADIEYSSAVEKTTAESAADEARAAEEERSSTAAAAELSAAASGEDEGPAVAALSREERRRLRREMKEKKRERKRRKREKKKRKRRFADDEAEESETEVAAEDAVAAATADETEAHGAGGSAGGHLRRVEKKKRRRRRDDEEDDDETLGGFIERDKDADIHEAADERISVDGGIHTDNGLSDQDENYGEGRRRTTTEFDRTLERIRQRKKRRQPMSNEECSLYCNRLLQQMSDAMQRDVKAMEEGRIATAKLQMLDFVCAELVKPKWRHWFLAEGCCQCIAAWLAPFKDNSLSNFTLRNKLLHVLAKLPISSQDLLNNDLGKVLVLLWDHPEESDVNRVLIRQLIQRWTRPMLGLGSSHREFLQERDRAFEANELELQHKLLAAAKSNLAASSTQGGEAEEAKRRHARVPINSGHSFIIQPKSEVVVNERPSARSNNSSRLLGRLMDSKIARRPTRAQKLSIEGRGL